MGVFFWEIDGETAPAFSPSRTRCLRVRGPGPSARSSCIMRSVHPSVRRLVHEPDSVLLVVFLWMSRNAKQLMCASFVALVSVHATRTTSADVRYERQ
jgi:hypothetical protein